MAGGWARDGAVQDQIDDTVSDAVSAARARLPVGESERWCVECGGDSREPPRSPSWRQAVRCLPVWP